MTEVFTMQYPDRWEAWFADGWGAVARGQTEEAAVFNLIKQYPDFAGMKVTQK